MKAFQANIETDQLSRLSRKARSATSSLRRPRAETPRANCTSTRPSDVTHFARPSGRASRIVVFAVVHKAGFGESLLDRPVEFIVRLEPGQKEAHIVERLGQVHCPCGNKPGKTRQIFQSFGRWAGLLFDGKGQEEM